MLNSLSLKSIELVAGYIINSVTHGYASPDLHVHFTFLAMRHHCL